MARTIHRLTSQKVDRQKTKAFLPDGGGLYFRCESENSKIWIFRFALHGRTRDMSLGSVRDVSLADARAKAMECRRLRADGVDPLATRNARRAAHRLSVAKQLTFEQATERYIAATRASWRNIKHADQWASTMQTYAYPKLAKLDVRDINTSLVMAVLEPIWFLKAETANRVRGRIETVIDSAKARGEFDGENPARWKGHLDKLLPRISRIKKTKNFAALPWPDLPQFMHDLQAREGVASAALEMLILTCTRTSEVLGARWDEIDFAKAVWTIPADRMKAGRDHTVPLSTAAVAVLNRMNEIRTGEFVFFGRSGGGQLSNMALLALLRRMGRTEITAHGFRSCFRDWAAEHCIADAVAEATLAHTVSDKVIRAYQRTKFIELRRGLMGRWSEFCSRPVESRDNVTMIRAAQ